MVEKEKNKHGALHCTALHTASAPIPAQSTRLECNLATAQHSISPPSPPPPPPSAAPLPQPQPQPGSALRSSPSFAMPLYEIMCIATTRATQQQLIHMLGKLAIVVQKGE